MNKLIYILSVALIFVSCKKDDTNNNYVSLSGTITNAISDSLVVAQNQIIKSIKVNPDGTFSDTLKVEPGNYVLFDGKHEAYIYLKNGFNLNITVNTQTFDESISFKGKGEEVNNYLAEKVLLQNEFLNYDELMRADKAVFDEKINSSINQFQVLLSKVQNVDSLFVNNEEKNFEAIIKQIQSVYSKKSKLLVFKGKPSPKFNNYENYKGGTTSLDDLRGKYVYIDLWATWCGPCKAEIPFLQNVEKAYHNKNIAFVSISLDRENAYQKWRDMVKQKEMSGIQLYAKGDQKFARDYNVSSIPRFILIDPKGNVIDANAPRPSSKKLITLFNQLNI